MTVSFQQLTYFDHEIIKVREWKPHRVVEMVILHKYVFSMYKYVLSEKQTNAQTQAK